MTTQQLTSAGIRLVRLSEDTEISSFESEDKDLNDFLRNDAKNYLKSLLAVTYLLQVGDETVAYFSLSNDSLIKNDGERPAWNRINRAISNEKRRRTYPAVKIGRLAIDRKYAGMGLGSHIILAIRGVAPRNDGWGDRAADRLRLLPRRQPARVCPRTFPPGVAALRALPRAIDIVALRATPFPSSSHHHIITFPHHHTNH